MKSGKEIINSPIARSTFYIIFVGGLFTFSSYLFTHLCNWAVMENLHWPCLSFLESAGILSFGYIVFFSFKFGYQNSCDNVSSDDVSSKGQSDKVDHESVENVEKLSEKERARLKEELAKQLRMN